MLLEDIFAWILDTGHLLINIGRFDGFGKESRDGMGRHGYLGSSHSHTIRPPLDLI